VRKGEIRSGGSLTGRQLKGAEKQILDMFAEATEETFNSHPGLIKRYIDNKLCEAKYYRRGKWRFVVCDENTIVTVEENLFDLRRKLALRKKGHMSKRKRAKWEGFGKK